MYSRYPASSAADGALVAQVRPAVVRQLAGGQGLARAKVQAVALEPPGRQGLARFEHF
jgi:hypothetical protein